MNAYLKKYLLLQGAAIKQFLNSLISVLIAAYIAFLYVPYQIVKSIIRNYKLFNY